MAAGDDTAMPETPASSSPEPTRSSKSTLSLLDSMLGDEQSAGKGAVHILRPRVLPGTMLHDIQQSSMFMDRDTWKLVGQSSGLNPAHMRKQLHRQ